MTIITHDIIAVCVTVIRNNSEISNKIFSVCENRSLKINWHITHSAGAKGTKEITKYLNSVRLFRQYNADKEGTTAIVEKYRNLLKKTKQARIGQIILSGILPVFGKRIQGYRNSKRWQSTGW